QEVAGAPVPRPDHHADDSSPGRGLDPEQSLHGQAVGNLVEERGRVVGSRDERDTLLPRPVFGVCFDARVQVADDRPARDDVLAVELQDQPKHPVRRGVLRAHVDDHGLLANAEVSHGHSPLWSGGGMNAPLYCVLTPASGWSLRRGYPTQSSGISMRRRSGWPSKMTPKKSNTSRSNQFAVGYRSVTDDTCGGSGRGARPTFKPTRWWCGMDRRWYATQNRGTNHGQSAQVTSER